MVYNIGKEERITRNFKGVDFYEKDNVCTDYQ